MQGTTAVVGFGGFDRGGRSADAGIALLRQRHARAGDQRSLGVQDLGRRLLAGSDGAADRHRSRAIGRRSAQPARAERIRRSTNQGTTQPKFDGARRLRLSRTARKLSFSGGVAGTDGIMHTGIGPFDINERHGDGLRQGELHEPGLPRRLLHEHPQRRRRQPADQRCPGQADRRSTSTRGPTTSKRRTFRPLPPSTSSATAATCASIGSTSRIAPHADNRDGMRRLRPGRDLPLDDVPAGRRRARRSLRLPRTTSCSRRA